jgi:hypothetical protein
VGGRHGTIVDPQGIVGFVGGAVDLRGNNAFNSNQDFSLPTAQGAYVDLPNGVFTDAVKGGTFLDATLEIWFTEEVHRNWARLFDIGTSDNGEDTSANGSNSDYVFVTSAQGTTGLFVAETHAPGAGVQFPTAGFPGSPNATIPALPVGRKYHVALVLNQAGSTGQPGENGTARLYLDGQSVGSAPIVDGLFLDFMNDNNVWLGRSQWADELYDGTFDEFRIYDTALSDSEVAASFAAGPVAAPLPVLEIDRVTGAVTIANRSTTSLTLQGYTASSAAGSLVGWDTIAPANGWTASSATATQVTEAGAGIPLAPGGTISLGNGWTKSIFEDVQFSFQLSGGNSGVGAVQYAGDAIERSDLNGDGAINVADWTIFRDNHGSPLGVTTTAAAYLKGDLNGDLANNASDFLLFKADFIAANGAAAFAALSNVPEPTAAGLTAAGLLALVRRRRR